MDSSDSLLWMGICAMLFHESSSSIEPSTTPRERATKSLERPGLDAC
jgi:hypothetical protein